MFRTSAWLTVLLLVASFHIASAQSSTAPAPAPSEAKPSKMKLTMEKLKEMRAKWVANKPVKAKGLIGDDRWFYIQDCMNRS